MKARDLIEDRVVIAAAARSVADRLNAVADKLGLSDEQRQQIQKTHSEFDDKYHALRAERRELMQQELKAVAAILTPEQREKVRDFCEDRVVIDISVSGAKPTKPSRPSASRLPSAWRPSPTSSN